MCTAYAATGEPLSALDQPVIANSSPSGVAFEKADLGDPKRQAEVLVDLLRHHRRVVVGLDIDVGVARRPDQLHLRIIVTNGVAGNRCRTAAGMPFLRPLRVDHLLALTLSPMRGRRVMACDNEVSRELSGLVKEASCPCPR